MQNATITSQTHKIVPVYRPNPPDYARSQKTKPHIPNARRLDKRSTSVLNHIAQSKNGILTGGE